MPLAGKWSIGSRLNPAAIPHLVASLILLAIAAFVIRQALRFSYMTPIGPGPGFFPVWVGGILALLSTVLFVQSFLGESELPEGRFWPDAAAAGQIVTVLVALVLFAWALERIGYSITAFIFSFGLFVLFGGAKPYVTLPLAIGASFGIYAAFRHLLGVRLPNSPLGLLPALGI